MDSNSSQIQQVNPSNSIGLDAVYTYSPGSKIAQDPMYRAIQFFAAVTPHIINGISTASKIMANNALSEAEIMASKVPDSEDLKAGYNEESKRTYDKFNTARRWAILGGDIATSQMISNQMNLLEDSMYGSKNSVMNEDALAKQGSMEENSAISEAMEVANSINSILSKDKEDANQSLSSNFQFAGLKNIRNNATGSATALLNNLVSRGFVENKMDNIKLQSILQAYKETFEVDRRASRVLDRALDMTESSYLEEETKKILSKPSFGQLKVKKDLIGKISKHKDKLESYSEGYEEARRLKEKIYELRYSMR